MQASPSARPIQPIPSFVLPLMLTAVASTPNADARAGANLASVRTDPRLFGDDGDVGVLHRPAERSDTGDGGPKHLDRVAAAMALVRVGEHFPDVASARGAEHGVGQGVRDGVTVGVANEADVARNPAAAQDHLGARSEAVGVVADSHPDRDQAAAPVAAGRIV